MKNIRGILAGVLALAALMVSCVAELDTTPEVDITTVRCTIPRIDVEEDFATGILDTLTATKATFSNSNFLWSAGDKIGIVPNTGAQIYFEVDNGAGTSTASFDGGDWAMKSTGTFYAYYPLCPDIFLSKDHVSVSYTGQTQSGNNNNLHTGDYWTLYTEGTTAVGNALNFSFNHLTSFFKTYVTVPAGTYTKITISAPTEVFIKDGYFDLSAQTPTIVGTTMTDELCLDLQNVTFADETELTGYLVLAPVDITGVPITVTVYKDGEPAYEYTLTKANPMVAAKTYAFRATAITQLAASAAQANALYAAGATSVSITEPLTEDMAIVLPNTSEAVTLILPTTASTSTLTVSYPQNAASYPATVTITGPEGADLDIRTPNSTVTVNGIAYDQVISRTAANTCIIPVGVTVNNLKVVQGGVQVYGTVSQIDLSEQEDEAIINVSGTVTSLLGEDNNEYVPATGVTLNKMSINLNSGSTETLIATIAPVGAYPNVVWSSSDDAVATVSAEGVVTAIAEGSATITATTIFGGFTATCVVTVKEEPQYVDLGLSVLWATCNLGASSPEEYGDYFAWGEIEPYYIIGHSSDNPCSDWRSGKEDGYIWSSYRWGNGQAMGLSKYNYREDCGTVIDEKRILDLEDDAAFQLLGDSWRMPTKAEIDELINSSNCSWDWATVNGVSGYKVKSKKPGYTSNWIFLPYTGSRLEHGLNNVGTRGIYWSSTLDDFTSCGASCLSFNNTYGSVSSGWIYRYSGGAIRPVNGGAVYLDKSILDIEVDDEISLSVNVFPASTANKAVSWTSSNPTIATVNSAGKITGVTSGTTTITVTSAYYGKTATCTVNVSEKHDGVQLWEDGPYWAICNVGAESSSEMGLVFSWGNIQGITDRYKYEDDSYDTSRGAGLKSNIPAYYSFYDGASSNWCKKWRMPTLDEFRTLINADGSNKTVCTITASGLTIRGKGVYDKNTVFLPLFRSGTYTDEDDEVWMNHYGLYWTSSFYDGTSAYALSAGYSWTDYDDYPRYSCLTSERSHYNAIRPVHD